MTIIPLAQRPSALVARYQITTPMFLGGSDSRECAEKIRPSSLKGALRFWWRALNWGRVYSASGKNTDAALQQLHKEEGALFGLAAKAHGKEKVGGQSVFRLRIRDDESTAGKESVRGIPYLLGQGLTGKNERPFLGSGSDFTVYCYPSPQMSSEQSVQLEQALLCLGMLGGLGARSRKGLGSLSIQDLSGGHLAAPQNRGEYIAAIQGLLKSTGVGAAVDEPPYSAFSLLARIDVSLAGRNAMNLLVVLNTEQQMYRSWGSKGWVNGKEAERNFKDDHDWAYDVANGKQPITLPDRMVFGLPHIYHLSSNPKPKNTVTLNYKSGEKTDKRRASPLFAHVHQFANGHCLLMQTLLQARFLSPGEKVHINNKVSHIQPVPDWKVIHKFMNRFSKEQGQETIHG